PHRARAPSPPRRSSDLGLPPGRAARAIRFRAPDEVIAFDDLLRGRVEENVARETGDFVVRRADGLFAYQLAVVVDDEEQGVTQVDRKSTRLNSSHQINS